MSLGKAGVAGDGEDEFNQPSDVLVAPDGSIFVADIAGLDQTMWTADDCDGDDGIDGTSDDGIANSSYENPGGGTGTTRYCLDAIQQVNALRPLFITDFLQR